MLTGTSFDFQRITTALNKHRGQADPKVKKPRALLCLRLRRPNPLGHKPSSPRPPPRVAPGTRTWWPTWTGSPGPTGWTGRSTWPKAQMALMASGFGGGGGVGVERFAEGYDLVTEPVTPKAKQKGVRSPFPLHERSIFSSHVSG